MIIQAFKKIVAYTVKKRFFVTLLKTDDSKEIIADADITTGEEINIHRPILLRYDLKVDGNLFLGKRKTQVSDDNGCILHTMISKENSANGEILGFQYDKCISTRPKDFIFLQPLYPIVRIYNEYHYMVEEFENKTQGKNWIFPVPSFINTNQIRVKFYFLNTIDDISTISFKYKIQLLDEIPSENSDNNFNQFSIKAKKGILATDNIVTNIIADNSNFFVSNKLCSLKLIRNKNNGSTDNFSNSIYLIGVAIEFDANYFSK